MWHCCLLLSYLCQIGRFQGYFNIILLRNTTVKLADSLDCVNFNTSKMGRHLLIQPATFHDSMSIVLMTSHLESTANCSAERKNQLGQVFEKMQSQTSQATVIFGGDTNLRDHEVFLIGGLAGGIVDVWEACGSPRDAKFTWDITANDNLHWEFANKPKLRFDRLFSRPGEHVNCLTPSHLSLVGKDRLPGCQRFPSDHWGIWCEFTSSTW